MNTQSPDNTRNILPDRSPLLRLCEAAEVLCVSRRTLELWLAESRIPFVRIGTRSRRILRTDLEAFIQNCRSEDPE